MKIILAVFVALAIAAVAVRIILRARRRKALRLRPLSKGWRFIVEENIPLYNRLPEPLKVELGGLIHLFLDEKTFLGCGGQEIDEAIKVTIAAQACILLLNRPTKIYPRLNTIYVYPSSYIVDSKHHEGDLVIEGKDVRLGESWHNGPVVLAWDSIAHAACGVHQGHNVVIHEFAHQLDQEDGEMNGAPVLHSLSQRRQWVQVFQDEYEKLCDAAEYHQYTILDDYGTTDPAEFFAVATEAFFEKSSLLHQYNPRLYEQLEKYYRLDPASWKSDLSL
jgi:Mlc titration factor MtfA (ptsG expression regulator)